jgi:hypothetical protein
MQEHMENTHISTDYLASMYNTSTEMDDNCEANYYSKQYGEGIIKKKKWKSSFTMSDLI